MTILKALPLLKIKRDLPKIFFLYLPLVFGTTIRKTTPYITKILIFQFTMIKSAVVIISACTIVYY